MSTNDFSTVPTAAILDSLCDVVDQARVSEQLTPSWRTALDAAYDWLLQQDTIEYSNTDHALRVESATEPGKFYVANGACQCESYVKAQQGKGQGVCWHRAAARLVRRALAANAEYQRATALRIAASIAAQRKRVSDERWAETDQLVSELYAA
jgi:hypothetical protein